MSRKPCITVERGAALFEEALSVRREFCSDLDFPRMNAVWRDLVTDGGDWRINTYRKRGVEAHDRKAGVIALAGKLTLVVDEELLENADGGCWFSNFILAHELGHIISDHHQGRMRLTRFQLFDSKSGKSNLPANVEELEADYCAVFFQCGIALFDEKLSAIELARRAHSNPQTIKKAQQIVRTSEFKSWLDRPKRKFKRVVL